MSSGWNGACPPGEEEGRKVISDQEARRQDDAAFAARHLGLSTIALAAVAAVDVETMREFLEGRRYVGAAFLDRIERIIRLTPQAISETAAAPDPDAILIDD